MERERFEELVTQEFPNAVPERFRGHIKNVALLVEDEPSEEVRAEEGLAGNETLLGLYRGIPYDDRGGLYGVGATLPDTITLYRIPILEEAGESEERVRKIIRETIWHEVAHYFGFSERDVGRREEDGTNYSR